MSDLTGIILFTGILLLAMILNFTLKKEHTAKITAICVMAAAAGGMLLYGYGYASVYTGSLPLAILRSLVSVCRMFTGENDFVDVKDALFMLGNSGVFRFWTVHLLAQYATVSAVITVVGSRLLYRMRLFFSCFGRLAVIYGANENSISFARQLADLGHNVVFVDEKPDDSIKNAVSAMGAIVMSDKSALSPDRKFLRSTGVRRGKKQYDFYALHTNPQENIKYAFELMQALSAAGISPQQTSMVMLGEEETHTAALQALGDKYGYGNVTVFEAAAMPARLLIQKFPPAATIAFDENGLATQNFAAAIIGFGQMGQAVLKQLVMSGQFEGSAFSVDVFAPDRDDQAGYLLATTPALLTEYNITLHNVDGRSRQLYSWLAEKKEGLRYIVVATGNENTNREISSELARYLARTGSSAQVYLCEHSGVTCCTDSNIPPQQYAVYSADLLCTGSPDKMAMLLNHSYCDNSKTPQENWAVCDYFSRMSSRASADFMPSMLIATGRTARQALENWNLPAPLLENLARTEHLRWCAFHYAMGFEKMPDDVYSHRESLYIREKSATGHSRIRVGKDVAARQHACLIPWEELDALSHRENSVTGGNVDYKEADRKNIRAIPALLSAYNK